MSNLKNSYETKHAFFHLRNQTFAKNAIFSLEASLQALHGKKSQITLINLTDLKSRLYTSIVEKLKHRLPRTNPAVDQRRT